MEIIEVTKPGYIISTDPAKLQFDIIHAMLSQGAYWAIDRPLEVVIKSFENSLCFGVYALEGGSCRQVGTARVVTDYATFAWLCDVFIAESERGAGLGKWLVETVINHPELVTIRRIMLATRDAHELYRRYGGFELLSNPERWMVKMNQRS